ncbi:alpha-amylase family glycosyl hydrolase [Archangium lipolyticum]|uniref:alpha-amylase family glycosyl hydrolase n=1 Tax=Archangium lipolyticum TaxID=2970465 RepID=UPI00214A14C2|nr:alpha-amylase family glycosyl hydrolase [Archangium lipolyticum]
MHRYLRYSLAPLLAGLLSLAGCDPHEDPRPGGSDAGTSSDAGTGTDAGPGDTTPFIRIHYRLQGGGDPKTWGVHFWGAGSTSPEWGAPRMFDKTDDFGAYTDVKVSVTADSDEALLGVIPVQCSGGNCKRDIETSVRFADLFKDAATPNIAECWITQGQAVQTTKPASSKPAFKVLRAKDFIDLGNGGVRLMFHAAEGSSGSVRYGTARDALDQEVTWAAADDINKKGLLITGLTPGKTVYYKVHSTLRTATEVLTDETPVLELQPLQFPTISNETDWATWGSKGIMYQLIVRTFADGGAPKAVSDSSGESGIDPSTRDGVGDLVGLKSMLPYLKQLGVDAIWMTPVFKAKSYHGYDTTDFYDIDPVLGTRKDFTDLTAAADTLGIHIILDLVQNHVADVNPWFVAGSNPKDPQFAKYHDWFVWSDEHSNMLADKHPWDDSAVVWACKNYMCYHQIFGAAMPELNFRNPEVRAEMKKIAEFWITLGADGFRLDASKHIDQFDDNHGIALATHGTHVWWKEFNSFVKKGVSLPAGAPPVLLAGENRWDEPRLIGNMVPYASDMDSQFDFPFRGLVSNFLRGEVGDDADFVKYVQALHQAAGDTAAGGNPNHYFERFLSNHDLNRPATDIEDAGGLVFAMQKQAATIVFTVPGMPVLYYGEEFGKKGKADKFLGNESWERGEFVREPMSWFQKVSFTGDKQSSWDIDFARTNAANAELGLPVGICKAPNPEYPYIKYMSEDDPHSWAAQKDDPDSLFNYYKKLIAIRKANALFTDSRTRFETVQNTAETFEYTLSKDGKTLTVVLNRLPEPRKISRPSEATDLLTGTKGTSFDVPEFGALILQ